METQSTIEKLYSLVSDKECIWAQPAIREKMLTLFNGLQNEHKSLTAIREKLEATKTENKKMKSELTELKNLLTKLNSAHEKVSQENAALEKKQQEMTHKEVEGKPAHLRIETPSLFDLKDQGWKIICENIDKMQKALEKGTISASCLGDFDSGKSFLLNLLGAHFDSGFSHRTNAILVSFPEKEGSYYTLIDTPGSKEAIQTNNQDLLAKLKKNFKELFVDEETPGKDGTSMKKSEEQIAEEESKRFQCIFRYLHNDRKIIDNLKEKFIMEIIDIIFIVVGKLSESESELIQRNVSFYEKILKSKNSKTNKNIRNKKLYVIHNYRMLKTIEAVKAQMKTDIFSCFKVEENPMFSYNPYIDEKDAEKYNKYLYRDSQDINHIVLAEQGTEAGDYFNTPAILFLKTIMLTTDHKSRIDYTSAFLDFCQKNLPSMLQVHDIKLIYDKEKKAIFSEGEDPIKIGRLYITDVGDIHAADTYVPGISRQIIETKDEITIIWDVELLDCKFKSSLLKQGGRDFLKIEGEKKVFDDANNATESVERFNPSRLTGPIYLTIPLLEDKEKPKVEKEDLQNGIWRFSFTYSKTNEIEI